MIKSGNISENALCSQFLTESTKILIENKWNYTEKLTNAPGIYGIGTKDKIFYIGSSIYIKSRANNHFDKICYLKSLDECSGKELLFYVLYFDDQSPIGKVYADRQITKVNYHENCLIYNLQPLLNRANKSTPPNQLNSEEEKYYRNLIVRQDGIQGFSHFLISALSNRRYSRWRHGSLDDKIYRKSQKIINSSEFLNLVNGFLSRGIEEIRPKQREVIRGIYLGDTYSDIAYDIECSSSSVQNTAKKIFDYFSCILGERITKQNFVSIVESHLKTRQAYCDLDTLV